MSSPYDVDPEGVIDGVHKNLPFDTYLKIPAISHSSLKPAFATLNGQIAYDMEKFRDAYEGGADDKPTAAKSLGSFIHSCLLEPHRVYEDYAVVPLSLSEGILVKGEPAKSPKATSEYKKRLHAWKEQQGDKAIVEDSSAPATFSGQMLSLGQNRRALDWLTDIGERELTIVWRDKITGIRCKGRIDMVCADKGILVTGPPWPGSEEAEKYGCDCPAWYVDLPSMNELLSMGTPTFMLECPVHRNKKPAAFRLMPDLKTTGVPHQQWKFWQFGVHTQLRSYSLGYETLTGTRLWPAVILVSTERPYRVWTAPFHPDTMLYAKGVYQGGLKALAEARKTGDWPGLPEPLSWNMPEWMQKEAARLKEEML